MTNEEHHNQETMKEFSNNSIFGKLTVNDHVPYLLLNGHSTSIFQPIQKKPTITFYHHLLYYCRFFLDLNPNYGASYYKSSLYSHKQLKKHIFYTSKSSFPIKFLRTYGTHSEEIKL